MLSCLVTGKNKFYNYVWRQVKAHNRLYETQNISQKRDAQNTGRKPNVPHRSCKCGQLSPKCHAFSWFSSQMHLLNQRKEKRNILALGYGKKKVLRPPKDLSWTPLSQKKSTRNETFNSISVFNFFLECDREEINKFFLDF